MTSTDARKESLLLNSPGHSALIDELDGSYASKKRIVNAVIRDLTGIDQDDWTMVIADRLETAHWTDLLELTPMTLPRFGRK